MLTWFVFYADPQREKLASLRLKERGYEVYLPLERGYRIINKRKTVVERPLFPRYGFVAIDLETQDFYKLRGTEGCRDVLRLAGIPKSIPTSVVDGFRSAEELNTFDRTKTPALAEGDKVRVTGPLADYIGRVVKADSHARIQVLFELFGQDTTVITSLDKIKRVAA